MKIREITVKNFFKYANEQKLDLTGSGIVGVSGYNGVGKSTILIDSILFAFYAKYRTPKIDDVVNRYIGKDCKVGVEFEQDGDIYKVIRYRKHTTHNDNVYIFKNDKDISGHTATDTNNIILDVIKMPHVAFTNSVVFSTELYTEFLKSKPANRLIILENILSLKEINMIYIKCKEFSKNLEEKINEVNTVLMSKRAEYSALESTCNNYSYNAKQKLLAMKQEKEELNVKINEAESLLNKYKTIDIIKEKEKLSNNIILETLKEQVKNKEIEKNSLKIEAPVVEMEIVNKYKDVDFAKNKLIEDKYNEDLLTIKAREDGYKLAKEKITSLEIKRDNISKELGVNQNKIIEFNKFLNSLNDSICPFCKQHMNTEESNSKKENYTKEINSLQEENIELEKELENVKKELLEQSDNYNWLIKDYNSLKEGLNKNFIPNSLLIEEQFKNAQKLVLNYDVMYNNNLKLINEIDEKIEQLNSKINSLDISNYSKEELDSLEEKINNQNSIILDYKNKIAIINSNVKNVFDSNYVDGLKKQLEEISVNITNIENDKKVLENDLLHYKYLQECFSNKSDGFKKYFIGNMIEMFNERINQYLPFFFSEKVNITFDKDLYETIKVDDFESSFEAFSQGQRQRAELAINFALFDIARVFFSSDNKLLILDEVDKGLDLFGIKAMLSLLKAFDKQLKIFIVSHNPLLTDEIENKIKIVKDSNGFSIIE